MFFFVLYVNFFQCFCYFYVLLNNVCWFYDNCVVGLCILVSGVFVWCVENCLLGVDVNFYLVIVVSLVVGFYGLEYELELSLVIQGEFEVLEELILFCIMYDVLWCLKGSVLVCELFGSEFVEGYVVIKSMELISFFDEISFWECCVLVVQV